MADLSQLSDADLLQLLGGGSPAPTAIPSAAPIAHPPTDRIFDLSAGDWADRVDRVDNPIPIQAPATNNLSSLSNADLMKAIGAPSAPSNPTGDAVANVASQFGKGLTFGFLDEAVGASAATENAISSLFGGGNGGTWSQNYNEMVNQQRAADTSFAKQNPKTALALNIAGGVAPSLLTLGATAPATAGTSVLGKTLGSLFGISSKAAPTIGQLAKTGAITGALSGAGESNDNRLLGAGLGAGIGAVAAPLIGVPLGYGTRKAGDFLAEHNLIPSVSSLFSPNKLAGGAERGSISGKIADVNPPGYQPEDLLLAKELKNTPIGQVLKGKMELDQAVQEGTPLFLPEAIGSGSVDRNAKFIANYDPSIEFSQKAIEARKGDAGNRVKRLMDVVAPEVDPTNVGVGLMNASEKAVTQLKNIRRDATSPMYKALEGQAVPDDIAIQLLDDPVIDAATSAVANNPAYKKELGKAEVGSFKYLQLTKEHLDDKVAALRRAGNDNEARIVADSRDKVVGALEQLKDFRTVTDKYKELSQPINKLAGTKEESGLLEGILNTERIKAHRAPAELLKLTPTQIETVKETLGEKGVEQLQKSARSLMQDILAQANVENQPALKLLQTEDITDKFRAMMGDEVFEKFAKGLDLEKRMAKGNNTYFANSPTQGLIQENAEFDKAAGFLGKWAAGNYKDAIAGLFGGKIPDDAARGLAKIYFDPKNGRDALAKILPLLQQYSTNKNIASFLGKQTGAGASREIGGETGSLFNPKPKTSRAKPALGLLGAATTATTIPDASASPRKNDSGDALMKAFSLVSEAKADDRVGADFTNKFNTSLNASDEKKFQEWAKSNNRLQDLADYDMRGFWKSGDAQASNGHFPDTYKKPNHETFSDESKYNGAKLPDGSTAQGGHWNGDEFMPASDIQPLVKAVIHQESKGNPDAVSSKGATGLMQLMPATGKEVLRKLKDAGEIADDVTYNPKDPEQNVQLGTAYLNQMLERFDGDRKLALAGYNYGPNAVAKLLSKHDATTFEEIEKYLPEETKDYVARITKNLETMEA